MELDMKSKIGEVVAVLSIWIASFVRIGFKIFSALKKNFSLSRVKMNGDLDPQ